MAEEKVILVVDLDATGVTEGLNKTTGEIAKLKAEQKELNAQIKALTAENKTSGAEWDNVVSRLASVTTELKAVKQEQRAYENAAKNAVAANKLEEGSLNQKRASLNAMQASYNLASSAMKANDEATKQLAQDIINLRREISDEEQQLGIFFRNVGNYPKSVQVLNEKLVVLNETLAKTDPNDEAFNKLEAEIAATREQLTQAVKDFGALESATTKIAQNTGDLNDRLKELTTMLEEAKLGSIEYAKIEAEIRKVRSEVENAGSAFGKFGAVISRQVKGLEDVGKAVTGGVAAFQLFQVIQSKNEEKSVALEKAMRAVAIVTATQAALQGVSATIEVASNATKAVKLALLETEIAQTRGLTAATILQAGAQAILNAIMAANPVMLIVAGIAALVGVFALLTSGTKSAAEQQEEHNKSLDKSIDAMKRANDQAKATQSDRLNLMKAQNASEVDLANQALKDFDDNKKAEEALYNKNLEKLAGLRKQYALTEDEDKKKELKKTIDDQVIANEQALAELRRYGSQRAVLVAEQAKAERDAQNKSANLRIAAMANDHARQVEGIKQRLKEELEANQGGAEDEKNLRQAAQNELNELYKGWAKEARDKKSAELDKDIELTIAKTKEGSEAELDAQAEGIRRRRDFDLKETGLTATAKALINQQAQDQLDAIEEERLNRKQAQAQEELTIEQNKQASLTAIRLATAVTEDEKAAANIQAITDSATAEMIAAETLADEKKALAIKEAEDTEEGRRQLAEKIVAIDQETAAKQLEISAKSAADISAITFQLEQNKAQASIDRLQAEADLETENGDARLLLKQQVLDEQYKKDVAAAQKTGADTVIITRRYEKAKQTLAEETAEAQLSATSKTLAGAASLFKQNTAAYKILASASALIDTYQSANAAYKSMVGIPTVGPVLAAVAAATAVASGLANVAKINGVEFYDGGYSDKGGYTGNGNPRSVSTSLGNKPYTYHKREYIAPAWLVEHPVGRNHVAALENMRTGGPRTSITGFYDGGYFDPSITGRVNTEVMDMYALENSLSRSISAMPNPVVFVEDINAGQSTVATVASRANV